MMNAFVETDGGRRAAGYRNTRGDCIARAVAITTGLSYAEIFNCLAAGTMRKRKGGSTNGFAAPLWIDLKRKFVAEYMTSLGFEWTSTMHYDVDCTARLRADELPRGRLVVKAYDQYTAFIDGVLYHTYDFSRNGTRRTQGYWTLRV